MESERILFTRGVLLAPEISSDPTAIKWASYVEKTQTLKVKNLSGNIEEFPVTRLSQSKSTDRIEFVSNEVRYRIRELWDTDGLWLSSLKTPVPSGVLEIYVDKGEKMGEELLRAYVLDDSPYVVGLVYETSSGKYVRMDSDWVLLSPNDVSFVADNIFSVEIHKAKSNDFIELYDKNYVSVSDLDEYESADSGLPEQSDD